MKIKRIVGFTHKNKQSTGHEVHKKTIAYDEEGQAHHVIFKVNKFHNVLGQEVSKLEACFSALANLLGRPQLVLKQDIVTNSSEQIAGIATEHASHMLLRMSDNPRFAQCSPISSTQISTAEFTKWLAEIKPIDCVLNPTREEIRNHTEVDELMDLKEKKITPQKNDIHQYINERKHFCASPISLNDDLSDKLDELSLYCQKLIETNQELEPDKLPLEWQSNKELAQIVYDNEWLVHHSNQHHTQNVQEAKKIARLDAGIGFNFLDSLPQNFFAQLMIAKEADKADVDMDSLADIFTTAYSLEEDDLHKGNIGYYITLDNNKPCFHFFKIDHDLMFINKLMSSRNGARFNQLHYTNQYFHISARDLIGFPDLQQSGNHYWPTKTSLFAKGTKAYHSPKERNAFKMLKNDPEFKQKKWLRFLKQAIVSSELIQATLQQPLSALENEGEKKASSSLIERAFSSRMAELQHVLLSIPEFCDYVKENNAAIKTTIMSELKQYVAHLNCTEEVLNSSEQKLEQLLNITQEIKSPCTPLQAALLTKTYRCYDTANRFFNHVHTKNSEGQTPFEYALEQYHALLNAEENKSLISYYADVLCDLYKVQPLECKLQYANDIRKIETLCSYHELLGVTSLQEFKKAIETLREKPGNSLKQDKVYALKILEKSTLNSDDLYLLKEELEHPDNASPLKFVKELRSELWIIKRIWGAYGNTSTYTEMNHLIQLQIEKLSSIPHNSFLPPF